MASPIIAVAAATVVSFVLSALWYLALGIRWRRALGWVEGAVPYRPTPTELAVGLAGELVMAVALWWLGGRLGTAGVGPSALLGGMMWLGFVVPTLTTNVVFQRRSPALLWQDGGHWLLLLAAQGAVIGLFR